MINIKNVEKFENYIGASKTLEHKNFYVSVDNRELDESSLFIAIVGERFNPLKHLDKVVESGCKYIAYEKNEENDRDVESFKSKLICIEVKDIELFIQECGKSVADYFKSRGGKLIGISGSNGKTTTKEMLYHILNTVSGNTICTQKNNNNHLGVPFTLFQIKDDTEFGIIELGSNHPGEIKVLCDIINPQFGVTTNIGDTHLEFFDNRENVFKEEGYLFGATTEAFFQNMDDEFLATLPSSKRTQAYGLEHGFEAGANFVKVDGSLIENPNVTGNHNFINLGVSFLIAKKLLHQTDAVVDAAETFKPTKNRSEWLELSNKKIFLDAYNANPSSMRAAIKGFSEHLGSIGARNSQACVVLGDMNELGSNANEFHQEVGKELTSFKFGMNFFVGRHANDYAKEFEGNFNKFETAAELKPEFFALVSKCDFIFIKGSRSLQLETILDIK